MRDCYGGGSGGGFSMAPEAPWHDGDDRLHGCYERGNNGFAAAPEVPWHTRDNGLHDYHKRGNGGFAIAPEAWLGNDGFAKATQALDAGEKVRVRDIWTPVPAAPSPFRGLEVSDPPRSAKSRDLSHSTFFSSPTQENVFVCSRHIVGECREIRD